tara:strand:- start:357 stop:1331 length:975 start_codon:yes stop_codon:yes gene_type:complete
MNDLEKILESFDKDEKTKDYSATDVGDEKIVFITTCQYREQGSLYDFNDHEYGIVTALLKETSLPKGHYQFIPAIRQPNVKEDDLTTTDYNEHRPFLYEDLEQVQPDLIIPLGNVAMKTLLKKSGLFNKRGREFVYEDCPVVPTYSSDLVFLEPKLRKLFVQDINNAYDKFVLNKNKFDGTSYVLCKTVEEVKEQMALALQSEVLGVDIETTGLDFKKDVMSTIAFSYGETQAFTIPIYHRESPFDDIDMKVIKSELASLMENEDIEKVFHNCQFDLKFLMTFGITNFNNIGDTKIMHSLLDENLPHGLMDLVKEYFPQELEKF